MVIEASGQRFGDVDRLRYVEKYAESIRKMPVDTQIKPIELVSRRTNGSATKPRLPDSGYQKLSVEVFDLKFKPIL